MGVDVTTTTTQSPTTMAPTTMAPTTMAPTTMAPTTMSPTTTMAPSTTTTTMAPSATIAPTPATSAAGMVTVAVCLSTSSATVTLERAFTMNADFDGTTMSPVTFAAFNTANNNYPAQTVSGRVVAGSFEVTVAAGSNSSTFMLGTGTATDCTIAT